VLLTKVAIGESRCISRSSGGVTNAWTACIWAIGLLKIVNACADGNGGAAEYAAAYGNGSIMVIARLVTNDENGRP
jgi:hypothetical protein